MIAENAISPLLFEPLSSPCTNLNDAAVDPSEGVSTTPSTAFAERFSYVDTTGTVCGADTSLIGRGAHSSVHRVQRNDGLGGPRFHAAKVIPLTRTRINAAREEFRLQALCSTLDGFGVINAHHGFEENGAYIIVMDLFEDSELYTHVASSRGLDIKKTLFQLLTTVSALHAMNIVHRDIKLENMLLVDGVVKLFDFGTAVQVNSGGVACLSSCCGSRRYMAPEIMGVKGGGKRYGQEVDMWSVGVVFYVLLFKQYPFPSAGAGGSSKVSPAASEGFTLPAGHTEKDIPLDLLKALFQVNPKARLTAADALSHTWFTS